MQIGERIYKYLEEKGMSQAEFVSRTGISQSTVSDWKIKKNNPSADKIMVICKALDISPYELLAGTEDMNNSRKYMDYAYVDKDSKEFRRSSCPMAAALPSIRRAVWNTTVISAGTSGTCGLSARAFSKSRRCRTNDSLSRWAMCRSPCWARLSMPATGLKRALSALRWSKGRSRSAPEIRICG